MKSEQKPRAVLLRDNRTRALQVEFSVPTAAGTMETLILPHEMSSSAMAKALRARTTLLPDTAKAATNLVDTARKLMGAEIPVTSQPGWKTVRTEDGGEALAAFVTPGFIANFRDAGYRWQDRAGAPKSRLGAASTSTGREQARALRKFAGASSYLTFAMMCALAGPLRRFARLSEGPVFNLFGPSSTGKTTAARVAASIQGHPDAIASWDQKARGLEETASAHNDLLLILNAAERIPPKERSTILERVVHMVAEGESTVRSVGVHADYPDLAWRGCTLSTSNLSGRAMANALARAWEDQDTARFIDIEVPSVECGGIFDRLKSGKGPKTQPATTLLRELDVVLERHYGAILRPWIAYLRREEPYDQVETLIDQFLGKVGSPSGLEERIARKFGLIYAAGKLARKAGIFAWSKNRPLNDVRKLYLIAAAGRGRERASPARKFRDLLNDPDRRGSVNAKGVVRAQGRDLLAIDLGKKRNGAVGVRLEALRRLMPGESKAILTWLQQHGVSKTGHGGKRTRQIPIRLKLDGRTIDKPRLLILDGKKLNAAFRMEGILG